jgi:iron(III) transport system ATP-binding protein
LSNSVVITSLTKTFVRKNREVVVPVQNASLEIIKGEMLVLLGPSGCGKTTLLRCIAGLETPDTGDIAIRGNLVFSSSRQINLPPESRNLGMIFQSYALWPHMSVAANVGYPLKAKGVRRDALDARVRKMLEVVDVVHLMDSHPGQLSGGQQQRVALARALASGEELVLFDEPLSNVDAKVRESVREDIATMQKAIGFSGVYVTHDQTEALELADRIAVLNAGRILQVGTPETIYNQPASRYVATFVGSSNEIAAVVERTGQEIFMNAEIGKIVAGSHGRTFAAGDKVFAIIRPEEIAMRAEAGEEPNELPGTVGMRLFSGDHVTYVVRTGNVQLRVRTRAAERFAVGETVHLSIPSAAVQVFSAREDA